MGFVLYSIGKQDRYWKGLLDAVKRLGLGVDKNGGREVASFVMKDLRAPASKCDSQS